jgi:hypothetical protein
LVVSIILIIIIVVVSILLLTAPVTPHIVQEAHDASSPVTPCCSLIILVFIPIRLIIFIHVLILTHLSQESLLHLHHLLLIHILHVPLLNQRHLLLHGVCWLVELVDHLLKLMGSHVSLSLGLVIFLHLLALATSHSHQVICIYCGYVIREVTCLQMSVPAQGEWTNHH